MLVIPGNLIPELLLTHDAYMANHCIFGDIQWQRPQSLAIYFVNDHNDRFDSVLSQLEVSERADSSRSCECKVAIDVRGVCR
jgi:hypothetical protein